MMPKPPHVVVIRCSLLDGFDPIGEIDRLIEVHEKACFGKYGQPLGQEIKETIGSKERDVYALLVRKGGNDEGGQYIYKAYRVLDVLRDELPKNPIFPQYYTRFMSRIRTWVWLAAYDGPTFNLDEIKTRSSDQPVLKSLGHSMKGHFNCVLRQRNNI